MMSPYEDLQQELQKMKEELAELRDEKTKALSLDGIDKPAGACELLVGTETLQVNTEGAVWLPGIEVDVLLLSAGVKRCQVFGGIIGAVQIQGNTEVEFIHTAFVRGAKNRSKLGGGCTIFIGCTGSLPV